MVPGTYIKSFFLLVISFLLSPGAFAQETAESSGTIVTNNNSIGSVQWSNKVKAIGADNQYATATALALGSTTNYLVVTGFGFNIPATATIQGISVSIEGHANGLFAKATDNSVKIVKGNTIVGDEKKVSSRWQTTDSKTNYGGSADAWGTTWTVSDINANDFGIAISVLIEDLLFPTVRIDDVRIKVHFNTTITPLPVELVHFDAQRLNSNSVELRWSTASETGNDFFSVERSRDGRDWQSTGKIEAAGNSTQLMAYSFTDHNTLSETTFYRLKQTDFTGDYKYSGILAVKPGNPDQLQYRFYPNPTTGKVKLKTSENMTAVNIFRSDGSLFSSRSFSCNEKQKSLDLQLTEPGIYLLHLYVCSGQVSGEKIVVK